MSTRLPVISGEQLIGALRRAGWTRVRTRGSHVRMERDNQHVAELTNLSGVGYN